MKPELPVGGKSRSRMIPFTCYDDDIARLDALVAHAKQRSQAPNKVNRATVLRDLVSARFDELEMKL